MPLQSQAGVFYSVLVVFTYSRAILHVVMHIGSSIFLILY